MIKNEAHNLDRRDEGPDSITRCHLTSTVIPIVMIKRSYYHLIFTMGFHTLVRGNLYVEAWTSTMTLSADSISYFDYIRLMLKDHTLTWLCNDLFTHTLQDSFISTALAAIASLPLEQLWRIRMNVWWMYKNLWYIHNKTKRKLTICIFHGLCCSSVIRPWLKWHWVKAKFQRQNKIH